MRALVCAAGVIGVGLGVLMVQRLLAEPAGADTPGPVDGVSGTVDQVVDPVTAALAGTAGAARTAQAALPRRRRR